MSENENFEIEEEEEEENIEDSMQLYEYTKNSFVVLGNGTKKHKGELKALKGKFSVNLKSLPNQACWLFSMSRLDSVKHFMKTGEVIVADLPEYRPVEILLKRL